MGSATFCEVCLDGTFSADAATACVDCSIGKYSNRSSSSCDECALGKFSNSTQSSSCTDCRTGKYQDTEGSAFCTPCQAGTYVQYEGSDNAANCILCGFGKTSNAGAEFCSDPVFISPEGSFSLQQVITLVANGVESVFAVDLDGDGDVDVLSASYDDDKIAWYENLDTVGTFSSAKIISTSANGANSVFAVDLDGDGDIDVLSASRLDDKIAWYENVDGSGSFTSEHTISVNANGATSVFAVDLDGDGDVDVLSASYDDDKIAWYKHRI